MMFTYTHLHMRTARPIVNRCSTMQEPLRPQAWPWREIVVLVFGDLHLVRMFRLRVKEVT